jgi:hypothetical protein
MQHFEEFDYSRPKVPIPPLKKEMQNTVISAILTGKVNETNP